METEFLLMRLEALATEKGQVILDASDLKSVLGKVKNLEQALADSLALLYDRKVRDQLAA